MAITDIRVGEADFSLDEELSRIMRESPSAGGVASFVGLVRNKNDGAAVSRMTLEHYPGMTEKSLEDRGRRARTLSFGGCDCCAPRGRTEGG